MVRDFGKIDILVNNAGITRDTLLMRMTEEQWDSVIAVNLKSVFNLTKAVLQTMLKQEKRINNQYELCRGSIGQCRTKQLFGFKGRNNRFYKEHMPRRLAREI